MAKRSRGLLLSLMVAVAVSGAVSLGTAPAQAAAYACGSQCNGHAPTWAIPSSGVRCSNSAILLAQGNPITGAGVPDRYMTAKAYYSSVCQTMWMVVTNSRAIGRSACYTEIDRFISPTYSQRGTCPAAGHSVTTNMIDIANNGALAGIVTLAETTANAAYSWVALY
jgi:hypothetical protein